MPARASRALLALLASSPALAPEGCVERPLAPVPYCADTVPVGCMPACSVATCGFNVQCLPSTCP